MPERSRADQLDQAIQAMLARPAGSQPDHEPDPADAPLLRLAHDLRDLPRENFKTRLKSELERKPIMATQAISAEPQTATATLRVKNAADAIEFYKNAFGAREIMRFDAGGRIAHAEIAIGNSRIMLGEEAPDYGFPGPETLGGSPMSIHLNVDDVDAFVEHAVRSGARPVAPVTDQFYGDRSGSVADPFGYIWSVATRKEHLSMEEIHRRFEVFMKSQAAKGSPIPEGYHTLTPYVRVEDAPAMIEFVQQVFGAEEKIRTSGTGGGIHAEVTLGDSMLMIGGPAEPMPTAFHIYVEDADAAYQRALDAGAMSIQAPADQFYGERSGSVKDRAGNNWYIATAKGEHYVPQGLHTVMAYLHPLRAEPVISFLKRAFGAEELAKYASPDGVVHHARIRIGDSILEMGEGQGPYQPMPTMFYMYVPDVDASYSRALRAGATSLSGPANQPYGDRTAGVKDAFGNHWHLATRL